MAKQNRNGHYCRICGEYKANEKFSGKGHAKHICKSCQSLSGEEKADMMRIRDIERVMGKYPFSRHDWELLEKYAKKYGGKKSGQFAKEVLDLRRGIRIPAETDEEKPIFGEVLDSLPGFDDDEFDW